MGNFDELEQQNVNLLYLRRLIGSAAYYAYTNHPYNNPPNFSEFVGLVSEDFKHKARWDSSVDDWSKELNNDETIDFLTELFKKHQIFLDWALSQYDIDHNISLAEKDKVEKTFEHFTERLYHASLDLNEFISYVSNVAPILKL